MHLGLFVTDDFGDPRSHTETIAIDKWSKSLKEGVTRQESSCNITSPWHSEDSSWGWDTQSLSLLGVFWTKDSTLQSPWYSCHSETQQYKNHVLFSYSWHFSITTLCHPEYLGNLLSPMLKLWLNSMKLRGTKLLQSQKSIS